MASPLSCAFGFFSDATIVGSDAGLISSCRRRSVADVVGDSTVGNAASVAKAAVVLATAAVRLLRDMYHGLVVALVSVVAARVVCCFAAGRGAADAGIFRVGVGFVGFVIVVLGVLSVVVLNVVVLNVVVLSVVVFGGFVAFVGFKVTSVSVHKRFEGDENTYKPHNM